MVTVTKPTIYQNNRLKMFRSESYSYNFDLRSGHFQRWGKTIEDDPVWSPYSPEILDVEISAKAGCPLRCSYCYKGNNIGGTPTNMSFATFKTIFDKLPHVITKSGKKIFFVGQIAFGITSVNTNPDLFEIFDYCRQNSVIPNVTINGMDALSDETIRRLVFTCGAIAVSINKTNYHKGVQLIQKMTDYGATQINMPVVIASETIDYVYDIINGIKHDPRLSRLNAIVFLGLKPKNRGSDYKVLPEGEYTRLIKYCLEKQINFGFDSCSCGHFIKSIQSLENLSEIRKKELYQLAEPCESGNFSAYVDVTGKYWHCSFGENNENGGGIDLLKINDFHKEVWMSEQLINWRRCLFDLKRECPLYPEIRSNRKNI